MSSVSIYSLFALEGHAICTLLVRWSLVKAFILEWACPNEELEDKHTGFNDFVCR